MKKIIMVLTVMILFIGGCSMFDKPKITKEQQNNIATRIVRRYDIREIEFISFTQNKSTGSYILIVKINGDESKKATLLLNNINVLDKNSGEIGLSPIDNFKDVMRKESLKSDIELSRIKITYIGER